MAELFNRTAAASWKLHGSYPGALEALATRHGMRKVFGTARMYTGSEPPIALERVFGVTTFELG